MFGAKDLPAAIYLVSQIPNLPARIFALVVADLAASILGELGIHDLPAAIFAAVANLPARMVGVEAPNLPASIGAHPPGNLGAIIWSPLDLRATIASIFADDLPANITGFGFKNLPAQMFGLAAPRLFAFVRGLGSGTDDLPASMHLLAISPDLPATVTPTYPGPNDVLASIAGTGGYGDILVAVRSIIQQLDDLGASIGTGGEVDLGAIIELFGADNLQGIIGTIPLGAKNKDLIASLLGLIPADLSATMEINRNVAFLGAYIESLRATADLNAFIRVAETFITAILTVSTMASRSLRATIGNPACEGGSANHNMLAFVLAQHARDLHASLISFAETNLGASINTPNIIHALDVINVLYSPRRDKKTKKILALDTLDVRYSPFRGQNLGAFIFGDFLHTNLAASIVAGFPLPRVLPTLSLITAADLRSDDLDIQQIRLQLEGALLEFLYVNGTDDALIFDPSQQWKINIRSFKPIASNLFGDFAAARVCRLGSLTSYATIDEAVRACINAVIGLEDQAELAATIHARGQLAGLRATLGVNDVFSDLTAFANRVFPSELLNSTIESSGGYLPLVGTIVAVGESTGDMSASIDPYSEGQLAASITGV